MIVPFYDEELKDYLGTSITKKTLCKVGCHVWVWTSYGTGHPQGYLNCDCGMYQKCQEKDDA